MNTSAINSHEPAYGHLARENEGSALSKVSCISRGKAGGGLGRVDGLGLRQCPRLRCQGIIFHESRFQPLSKYLFIQRYVGK